MDEEENATEGYSADDESDGEDDIVDPEAAVADKLGGAGVMVLEAHRQRDRSDNGRID